MTGSKQYVFLKDKLQNTKLVEKKAEEQLT